VLEVETHAEYEPAEGIAVSGIPKHTTSPVAAPVTVMVKSETVPAAVLGKFNVAVALNTFKIAVPLLPITTPPAVTFSAVFVVPPLAVRVSALLVEEVPVRVFEIVAPVDVINELKLDPDRPMFNPIIEPLTLVLVVEISSSFPDVKEVEAR
jgi:hypothetical protein